MAKNKPLIRKYLTHVQELSAREINLNMDTRGKRSADGDEEYFKSGVTVQHRCFGLVKL